MKKKHYAVYEIMWKNTVKSDRPNITTQHYVKKERFAHQGKNKDTNS